MTQDTCSVFDAALSLPLKDRAELAGKLLESLSVDDQHEIENSWADEALARLRDYDEGKMKAFPFDEVMRRLRQGSTP
jgi:putative addiction module component (TIGR02574 family)